MHDVRRSRAEFRLSENASKPEGFSDIFLFCEIVGLMRRYACGWEVSDVMKGWSLSSLMRSSSSTYVADDANVSRCIPLGKIQRPMLQMI
ncbi:hypothetical protein OESDEN_01305 [Oesophagostomum dentatum]|uniref:Uncharacterized protein n=1 Tax=Oesophagostomum dentatum TaxID=61180 RepID=A0A0B1TTH4_OESDE|nr:hypothetical protein OESDEN_01305 [Oesophagostomum dentatum]